MAWTSKPRAERIVIIGCGAAGLTAATEIIASNPDSFVMMLTGEAEPPYSRPMLSHVLAGEANHSQIYLGLGALGGEPRFDFKTDRCVEGIFPRQHQIILTNGRAITYDKLLIATGSDAAQPPIPGLDLPGVLPLMTLRNLEQIEKRLPLSRKAVVIGAGLIGLRAAYALRQRGMDVTVVELLDRVLTSVLDNRGSELVVDLLKSQNVPVQLQSKVVAIEGDQHQGVNAILLEDGTRLSCDLLLQCTGVRPALECVVNSGLATERGILVNDSLQTSHRSVYAAGDCAEPINPVTSRREILATWTQAKMQGRVAGRNLSGDEVFCSIGFAENAIGFFGIPCVTFGVTDPPKGDQFEEITFERPLEGAYQKLVIKDDHIVGAVFYKDIDGSGWINRLMRDRVNVSVVKQGILTQSREYMEFLQALQADEIRGDFQWEQSAISKLEYKKRFDGEGK
ncbi:MAG: FAD-dependent oxidoreductase [bacterium]|nr:FAD-dependent oxidoreductase [bacterium]